MNLPNVPALDPGPRTRPTHQKFPEEMYAQTLADRRHDLRPRAAVFDRVQPGRTARHARKWSSPIEINAPADKVWAVIGNFQDASWIPAVAKTEGKGGNDVGATRTLTLQSGGTIEETAR